MFDKYTTMKLYHYFTLLVALTISICAAYYSIVGLTAIFAASALPVIIMGSTLELAKITGAVWLKIYWKQASLWIKLYLIPAIAILMVITSIGIFGFLSKAHIEQTAAAEEGVAQIARIDEEIARQESIINTSNNRINEAENSIGIRNTDVQAQIDKEQVRIDTAYDRIQPAIAEQNVIIQTQLDALEQQVLVFEKEIESLDEENARLQELVSQYRLDLKNTSVSSIEEQVQPYKDQIVKLDEDLARINTQANEYEQRISDLELDNSTVDAIDAQITAIEDGIVLTTNKLQSRERIKIKEGQAVIGVTDDGVFGGNTRRALTSWVESQQSRIAQLQTQANNSRTSTQTALENERTRLTSLVVDLRGPQTENINARKQALLDSIDAVRSQSINDAQIAKTEIQQKIKVILNNDIPNNRTARQTAQDSITALQTQDSIIIAKARESIKQLRASADAQISASNSLIQRLRDSLIVGNNADVDALVQAQQTRIVVANNDIDSLNEQKYEIERQARELEAEVGPIKYIAEIIYSNSTDANTLEDSVRWMILLLVIVFDPLAVILTLAAVSGLTSFGVQKKSFKNNTIVETIEVEKIVEIETIKEVPVEKIVEIEKIVEVPVEKIVEIEKIVEVPVEKIVEIEKIVEDTDKINELAGEVTELLDTINAQEQKITKLQKQYNTVRNQPLVEPDFDLGDVSGASFGTTWPVQPSKGQLFLKVDILPNKLYKWNSRKWIEVDIDRVEDTLAYDLEYIKYLINEIKHGRREYEELSEIEQNQIKSYIRAHGSNEDIK
jgi:hypothetical protein